LIIASSWEFYLSYIHLFLL